MSKKKKFESSLGQYLAETQPSPEASASQPSPEAMAGRPQKATPNKKKKTKKKSVYAEATSDKKKK